MHLPLSPAQSRSDCTGYCTGTGAGKFYAIPWKGIFCTEGGAGSIPPLFLWSRQRKSAVYRGERKRCLPQTLALKGFGLLVYGS